MMRRGNSNMLHRSLFHGWRLRGAILAGIVVFILAGTFHPFPPGSQTASGQDEPGGFTNPHERDPEALQEGKILYQRLCIFCHGAGGRGAKGPDLTDDFWRFGGRDGEVFASIAAGRPGTQMGAFAGRITSDEIWKIIAYLRSQYYGALAKAKEKGVLTACADPHNLPFSEKDPKPTGFNVELAGEIAQRLGLRAQYFWIDTRKGLDRALGNSLLQKRCDFFIGVPAGEIRTDRINLTDPYLGYVPEPGLRWNLVIALREADKDLKATLDQTLNGLMNEGVLQRIAEQYGVAYHAPFK